MIHIVFNEAEIALMQQVQELDETLSGPVVLIRDDYAVGPLTALDEPAGYQARRDWWQQLLEGSPYKDQDAVNDDRLTVHQLQRQLEEEHETEVWIWMGQNQHDVCGYYWLMPQLRAYQGRVMILYLNNLPFINEKGQIFYPSWLHEIQPSEFIKAKKLARPITLSEYEVDPDEWKRLSEEDALVRILEGGKKIASQPASFYDAEILKHLSGEWQKVSRALQHIMNRLQPRTGDVFIMWRIKTLIAAGRIQAEGNIDKDWKSFDIKKGAAQAQETEVSAGQSEA
ncbi:hypothetical protein GCM10027051_11920 [Niabella terrae]